MGGLRFRAVQQSTAGVTESSDQPKKIEAKEAGGGSESSPFFFLSFTLYLSPTITYSRDDRPLLRAVEAYELKEFGVLLRRVREGFVF